MAVVYIATNLTNGKRYIGATIGVLEKRKREHKCAAKRKNPREKNMLFYKAIRKYGFKNFNFTVLITCEREKVFFEEIRMIALLRPEYNGTKGGEGCIGRKMSDYCRRRLAEGRAQPHVRENLKKIGLENREGWKKYASLGPKTIARKVICLDDNKIYESASAAARQYGAAKSAVIELCLGKKYRKTVNGLRFMYYVGPSIEAA